MRHNNIRATEHTNNNSTLQNLPSPSHSTKKTLLPTDSKEAATMKTPFRKADTHRFVTARRSIRRMAFGMLLLLLPLLLLQTGGFCRAEQAPPLSSDTQSCQTEVDGSTTCVPLSQGLEVVVLVVNQSPYRADIYLEDGRFGQFAVTVDARGGRATLPLPTGVQSTYFVTKHGMRQALVAGRTDEPCRFTVHPHNTPDSFLIPADAVPSTHSCQDRYAICAKEAQRGECWVNPGWMIVHCCQSCNEFMDAASLIDPNVRCSKEHLNITGPIWKPGDLDALFLAWATADDFQAYAPRILSSPHPQYHPTGMAESKSNSTGRSPPPWVLVFDDFLSDDEADALIEGGRTMGFKRSTDQGRINSLGEQERVVSTTRTSSNAWCRGQCEALPDVQNVTRRIERLTRIPRSHYESIQILEYQPGQFYRMHHDSSSVQKVAGPRILTFFLYLSDVEEGGATAFNRLDGLAVPPKKGRALIWPSVLNEDPSQPDRRMFHEARPVLRGVKYAANHWIHLYPYEAANRWGCTGSFAVSR